ncbi:lactate utilization protein [Mitsuokella sp.]|uniref:lactate utilization protein n=1 Tax=Mitsuokella sp. TaxID=2049034 RepID=UPI003D7DD855
MDLETLAKNLKWRGIELKVFATKEEAADYLTQAIKGKRVGFGGSMTLEAMGLYEKLKPANEMFWHWRQDMPADEAKAKAYLADIYITSLNGVAETGELVNIDGSGNRVAATLTKHEKVYFVIGENKLAPDLHAAIDRARNIASPLNAKRLHRKTPCAVKADHCYDCKSTERICRSLNIIWEKPMQVGACELVLIRETLGY